MIFPCLTRAAEPSSLCQDFDSRTDLYNAGSTNEDHLKRAAGQRSLGKQDGGIDLASVGIAFNHRIEDSQAALCRVANLACKQNCPGAGSEDRVGNAKVSQGIKKLMPLKELEHRSGFSTGQNEPIEIGQLCAVCALRSDPHQLR